MIRYKKKRRYVCTMNTLNTLNTLHESDEFKAPREDLMCGDNKIVDGEVYCKPCDSGSFDWGTHKFSHSLASGAGFSEYCQSPSKPPEACSCGTAQGSGDGYVPAKEMFFGRGAIQVSYWVCVCVCAREPIEIG